MGEEAKHSRNDEACALRGWACLGDGDNEAINVGSAQLCQTLNEVMYSCLNFTLVGQNARAILANVSHQPLAQSVVLGSF